MKYCRITGVFSPSHTGIFRRLCHWNGRSGGKSGWQPIFCCFFGLFWTDGVVRSLKYFVVVLWYAVAVRSRAIVLGTSVSQLLLYAVEQRTF